MFGPQALQDSRYQLQDVVAESNFSKTFRAIDRPSNRAVRLTVYDLGAVSRPVEVAHRVQLIAGLNHPGLPTVYNFEGNKTSLTLALSDPAGTTLQERLKPGPLAPKEIGPILAQITATLDYIHSQPLIHGYLTPQSLLLTTNKRVVITGLEQPGQDETSFLAQAQLQGRARDIYALGILLYQMLTGQGISNQITGLYLVGQVALPVAILGRLETVIQRAVAPPPAARFYSAGELYEAYTQAIANTAVSLTAGQPGSPSFSNGQIRPGRVFTVSYLKSNPPTLPNAQLILPVSATSVPTALPVFRPASARSKNSGLLVGVMGTVVVTGLGALALVSLGQNNSDSSQPLPVGLAGNSVSISSVSPAATTPVITQVPTPTLAPATANPATNPATPLPAPTVKVPEGFVLYQNADPKQLNLEIAYPQGWTAALQDDGLGLTFSDTAGATSFSIFRGDNSSNLPVEAYNTRFIETYKKDGWVQRAESRFWAFSGEKWLQSSFQKGANRTWLLIGLHRTIPYSVVLRGADSTFDKYLGDVVGKMWDTLHFLDGPINYYTGEIKSYTDPRAWYTFNYPYTRWEVDTNAKPPKLISKDGSSSLTFIDITTGSQSVADLLATYKDKLANSGSYPNLKETLRFRLVTNGDSQEQSLRFSFNQKEANYAGELLVRKNKNQIYVGLAVSNSADLLDTMYFDLWRYTEFLK